jgi:iron-sulfur cluster repair protein YtfE (RIC family)
MPNLVDALVEDHKEVKQLFSAMETATGEHRRDLFDQLREQLVRHEVAEEEIVRPLTRKYVPGGDMIADARIAEESAAERLLKVLEKTSFDSAEWNRDLAELRNSVLLHAAEEESDEFPLLRQHVEDKDLVRYGDVFETAKKVAPTHPHPNAPNTAAGNLALGPIAAIVDRARDIVHKALAS